ncbi:MAG: tetratricopeptide repeat protein [Pseudomonadales bacterium]|nr:tetratricopeptide repeat protein [Pseudomonadales bacterium]
MVTNSTEEEQIEVLKKWIENNGVSLVVSIVLVLAVVFGYRSWVSETRYTAEAASAIYEELAAVVYVSPLEVLSEEKRSTGQFLAEQLKQEHPDSLYAHFAAMQLAKFAVEDGDLMTAAAELQWAIDNDVDEKVGVIVNYRLAKVKLAQKKYAAAHAQLDTVSPAGHARSYEELRGDIYHAEGEMNKARAAYQRAVNAQAEGASPLAQIKLDDIVGIDGMESIARVQNSLDGSDMTSSDMSGSESNSSQISGSEASASDVEEAKVISSDVAGSESEDS